MSNTATERSPRFFIDRNGGYQTERKGLDKEANDAWVKVNSWGLTWDDFIRLSYFHGCMDNGSDGSGPVNGSEDRESDVVYVSATGGALTRHMVSYWHNHHSAFISGYLRAAEARALAIEIADECARSDIEVKAHQVLSTYKWPVYNIEELAPGMLFDEDMDQAYREDIAKAVRYLELRGMIVRPVEGQAQYVSFGGAA